MKTTITRRRELRVNMGNYEHVLDTCEISIELDEDLSEEHIQVLGERANAQLDKLLEDDIRDLVAAQGNEDSFIYTWAENKGIN